MTKTLPIKIVITDEMQADYETVFGRLLPKKVHDFDWNESVAEIYCSEPPTDDIVTELIEYIEHRRQSCVPFDDRYFRVKYYDEKRRKTLLLFVFKGKVFKEQQEYEVRGLCLAKDWSPRLEEFGFMKLWINTTFDSSDDSDWVMEERMRGEGMDKRRIKVIMSEDQLRLARVLIADVYAECTREDFSKITDPEELKKKLNGILRMTQNFEDEYAARAYTARHPKKFMQRVLPVEFELRAEVLVDRIGEDVKKYREALEYRREHSTKDTGIPYGMSKRVAEDIRRDFSLMKKVANRDPIHQKFFTMVCLQGLSQSEFAKRCGVSKATATNVKIAFIKAVAAALERNDSMLLQEITESNSRQYFETVRKLADWAESIAFEKFILMDEEDDAAFDALVEEEYERLAQQHLTKRIDGEEKVDIIKGALQGKKSVEVLADGTTAPIDVIHGGLPKYNKYDT